MDIKKLIENAEKIKDTSNVEKTQKKVEIKRFAKLGIEEPYVVIVKPTIKEVLAIKEHNDPNYSLSLCMSSPNLQDKELQKAYGANNAKALLSKIFTEEEIFEMITVAGQLIETKSNIEIVDDLKN